MNKLMICILFFCLHTIPASAQVDERDASGGTSFQSIAQARGTSRSLGDLLWFLDAENLTGDFRLLGVCYNDNSDTFFLTGAFDLTIANLYEVTKDGILLNTWAQPQANWGGWGWRDLCFDGTYIYAGDPNSPYIVQIDPSNGMPTGVEYGPFPIVPCRALAYDPLTDSFWTASFTSSLYQCFRDSTFNTFSGPGLFLTGAGMEESNPCHPMIWFWSQDGSTNALASEYDPQTQQLTGKSFEAAFPIGSGHAGGASCRNDHGAWELVGMLQTAPDQIAAYDLDKQLTGDTCTIQASAGGTDQFLMNAGVANAGRYYAVFGGVHGHSPGTPLPGGMTTLPLNLDFFTNFLLASNPPGFLGVLNSDGHASVQLTIPVFVMPRDVWITFAAALKGPPWDFASNFVELHIVP